MLRVLTHSSLRASLRAAAASALALQTAQAAPSKEQEACRASILREDRLEAMAPRGELVLASGGRAVLVGLHWPDAAADADAAQEWLLRFRDRPLTLSSRGEDDRWGRVPIEAVADPLAETEEPTDLAAGLVGAGLAAVDVGESDALCRSDLLALEASARSAGLGLWQREPVRDARDGASLSELAGRFVVARGRIVNVGERSARTYLDFVRRGEDGLTVTVPKRTWRIMQARGLTAEALRGRVAQVRGILAMRRGPTLDIASADMIEVQDVGGIEGEDKSRGNAAQLR